MTEDKQTKKLMKALTEARAALYGARAVLGSIGNIPHAIELADAALGQPKGKGRV
mgnify:CR=1 FL=1